MLRLNSALSDLFAGLKTDGRGLLDDDARKRLSRVGPNSLEQKRDVSDIEAFLRQFLNPLVMVLLFSGGLSFFLGEISGGLIISILVLFSVCLQFYHERRSMKAAANLSRQVAVHATAMRDGIKREIEMVNIVPGDIVFLSAGDIIPGDCRLIATKDLYVNQAALTGEAFPVEKKAVAAAQSAELLTDMDFAVFMGSSVTSGMGQAVVVSTGPATEIGHIAHVLSATPPPTAFEHGIKEFSLMLVKIVFLLVFVIFFLNAVLGKGFFDSFLFAVAVSVGLTPELLPMIMTINLANGAIAMAKKGVIVKWLASIQNFGSMDILCSDKTGTLTEGTFKLVSYQNSAGEPEDLVRLYAYLNSTLQSDIKNPLDLAITEAVHPDEASAYSKVDEIPFDFVRRMLSVVVASGDERLLIVKGAPESVMSNCNYYYKSGETPVFDETIKFAVQKQFEAESLQGHKVIAVAYKTVNPIQQSFGIEDEHDLIFLGTLSFFDPPKGSVAETLEALRGMGVAVKVLTGDNELITSRVCQDVGIPAERILMGSEMDRMSDEALGRVIDDVAIYARLTPVQKNRVISLLKRKGHVVGYIGDGINDAPSLRTADVGISVNNAVDVAKEAASIILLEKSLGALKDGVFEGRRTFANTMKYIMMGTSSNFGNMFSMAVAAVMVPYLPMLPVQILLNNLLYDMSQITIPTDAVDPSSIAKPRRWDMVFIRRFMLVFGPVSSVFDILTFGVLIVVFHASESVFQTAWFIESLATQILVIYVIRSRYSILSSRPSKWLMFTTLTCVVAGVIVPYTALGTFFGFTPLAMPYLFAIAALVMVYLVMVENIKRWFYHRYGW
ncbi:magnesium-transporting ATPase [Anaerosporomusa subterranea]|uniref:Magnesium-transporting ATPase, P-type 1 n=1 Tax=Anaerosporomusa subterranea TaxID=1794912 RepID=A0A154BU73_ANASB|nr:magnesium-translocating P-type ATPase [Anaerosporomusa subterranea]KYZ77447.1 magnesium-transporting ATPase [Anaerosporomusa subterranea]